MLILSCICGIREATSSLSRRKDANSQQHVKEDVQHGKSIKKEGC